MLRKIPQFFLIGVPTVVIAGVMLSIAPVGACPWVAAIAAYALFLGYYQNWRGALTQSEIDRCLANSNPAETDISVLRAFLEADRGREFYMINLVEFPEGKVPHPDSGKLIAPHKLLESYSAPFFKKLVRRGGHPVLFMMRRGGDLDSWGPTAKTGAQWPVSSIVRYRSRRDFMELCTDKSFEAIHRFKRDAIAQTVNYPNGLLMSSFAGPRVFVALGLAVIAALSNVALLSMG